MKSVSEGSILWKRDASAWAFRHLSSKSLKVTDEKQSLQGSSQQEAVKSLHDSKHRYIKTAILLGHILSFAFAIVYQFRKPITRRTCSGLEIAFAISKGATFVLHIDVAAMLLPRCSNLLEWFMRTPSTSTWQPPIRIVVHQLLKWFMLMFTILHVAFSWVLLATGTTRDKWSIAIYLQVNLGTGIGFSGHVLLISTAVAVVVSFSISHTKSLSRLLASHAVYASLFVFWVIHTSFAQSRIFASTLNVPGAWLIAVSGMTFYMSEVLLGEYWATRHDILKLIEHPNEVIELQLNKQRFKPKIGQYIRICFPELSAVRYYSCILTSAPEDDSMNVHIHCRDKCNRDLARLLYSYLADGGANTMKFAIITIELGSPSRSPAPKKAMLPQVFVSGPFGKASERIFASNIAVLVGYGSGATACASVLKSIFYRAGSLHQSSQLRKVYFFWICHDTSEFEWFRSLLLAIEAQDVHRFIEIHTYVTAEAELLKPTKDRQDISSASQQEMVLGSPDWNEIFRSLHSLHNEVWVFYLGPSSGSESIRLRCDRFSDHRVKFVWYHERV